MTTKRKWPEEGHDPVRTQKTDRRLVLVGPQASIRRALFRRLVLGMGSTGVPINQGGSLARACVALGRSIHEVIDVPESRVDHLDRDYAKHAHVAVCVDPLRGGVKKTTAPYLERLRSQVWTSHCLVLVSNSGHFPESMEIQWRTMLESQQVSTRVFRVNCGDRSSPELFVKLFLR